MKKSILESENSRDSLSQINKVLKGTIKTKYGEKILKFNNELGHGKIRSIHCLNGLNSLLFDVKFKRLFEINLDFLDSSIVQFIFVIKGTLKHAIVDGEASTSNDLNKFQNIIISLDKNSSNLFIFEPNEKIKFNLIIASNDLDFIKKSYDEENNTNSALSTIFNESKDHHFGNYSLKIGDLVSLFIKSKDEGLIRRLSSDGYISLILSKQLHEYWKHNNELSLPKSLTKTDISKIKMLAIFIDDHITDELTISILSKEVSISARKMQLGFKILFSKSVNEYIRKKKLDLAAELLKNTDLSVSEVVYKVGYSSRSYFSKIFYDYHKILPNEFRVKSHLKTSAK